MKAAREAHGITAAHERLSEAANDVLEAIDAIVSFPATTPADRQQWAATVRMLNADGHLTTGHFDTLANAMAA